jgi:hypothetical protein
MKILPLFIAAICLATSVQATQATTQASAPDLDLSIQYYSRVLTPEGVTREARYEEKMMRRAGHVWVVRVLPKNIVDQHDDEISDQGGMKKGALKTAEHQHKHFNHVVIPRHVQLENNKLHVEYIDAHDKEVVAIPVTEYENVNFDGSWENTYYLLDPKLVKAMPLAVQASSVPGARWREREKNGVFQRVLWDDQKQIPLVMESGDKASTFYRRVEVKPQTSLSRDLPWQNLKGYAQKEYSDFLD